MVIEFPDDFDDEFAVGPADGNRAYFGRDVLRGLVEGIDEFINLRQERWRTTHSLGPLLLGSALWIDDYELIDKIAELKGGACIVIPKHTRSATDLFKLRNLQAVNDRTPGLPTGAFAGLDELAPRVDGGPAIIGPYDELGRTVVPTIRTIGYRKLVSVPPFIHAKLALLGQLWWTDEHPSGYPMDQLGFTPQRLWISSANFTFASRRHLEFGYWSEDRALMEGAQRFLLQLVAHSEALDPDTDALDPEMAPVEFDDAAMREALAD